jgi:hypothetical protein
MSDEPTIVEGPPPDAVDDGPDADPEPDDSMGDDMAEPVDDVADDDGPDEVEVDLESDEIGGDLFTGAPDEGDDGGRSTAGMGGGSAVPGSDDGDGASAGGDDGGESADGMADSIGESVNDGAARLAVVGLSADDFDDDREPADLEAEFSEVFEAFSLGAYASRCLDEYVLADDEEEVDPAWGLFGSALMAASLVIYLRPDGSEQVAELRDQIGDLGGLA